jgi:dihydroorotase (multifunctional complex type)
MYQMIVKGGDVLVNGELLRADIIVDKGIIVGISQGQPLPDAQRVVDATGKTVIPGIIDSHVHFREPGYEYKEDFYTGSRACAAGGITTWVDMPNVEPTPSTLERFLEQTRRAGEKSIVDYNHWAMPTDPTEVPKILDAGALGFKFFMKSDHYPYDGPVSIIDHARILETFRQLAELGTTCLVHPHNQMIWEHRVKVREAAGRVKLADHFDATMGDNDVTETTAIATLAIIAKSVNFNRLRILHIRDIPQIHVTRMLKENGYDFIAEANPWAVFPALADVSPTEEHLEANWQALRDGTIDLIGSDHAPHSREDAAKAGNNVFKSVIFPYPLCEHWLSMYLTEIAKGRLSLAKFSQLASENVARFCKIYPQKGVIRVGSDADLVVVDMDREAVIGTTYPVYSKMGFTPYEGMKVKGVPVMTVSRGDVVMENGDVIGERGRGKMVRPH